MNYKKLVEIDQKIKRDNLIYEIGITKKDMTINFQKLEQYNLWGGIS